MIEVLAGVGLYVRVWCDRSVGLSYVRVWCDRSVGWSWPLCECGVIEVLVGVGLYVSVV